MRKICVTSLLAAALAATGLDGCTIFGVKNPPTIKSTTSAEQYERLFWSAVKAKRWPQLPGYLGANVVYTAGGKALSKDQVVPYLQGANVADFTISGITVKPNGPDMTLTYTLQLSAAGGPVQTFNAVSVWQQVGQNLILIVHTEQPTRSGESREELTSVEPLCPSQVTTINVCHPEQLTCLWQVKSGMNAS